MSEPVPGAAERGWIVVARPDKRTRSGRVEAEARRCHRGHPRGGGPALAVAIALLMGCVGLGLSVERLGLDVSDDSAAGATAGPERSAVAAVPVDVEMALAEVLARARVVAGTEAGSDDPSRSWLADADRAWRAPTVGHMTSPFQARRMHPILRRARAHRGVDVSAPWGAPIVTPAAGLVVEVGTGAELGRFLVIDHGSGVSTRYAHCSQILVGVGQALPARYPIALVGDSGLATGPHLHYEVMVEGRHVDPLEHRWR